MYDKWKPILGRLGDDQNRGEKKKAGMEKGRGNGGIYKDLYTTGVWTQACCFDEVAAVTGWNERQKRRELREHNNDYLMDLIVSFLRWNGAVKGL